MSAKYVKKASRFNHWPHILQHYPGEHAPVSSVILVALKNNFQFLQDVFVKPLYPLTAEIHMHVNYAVSVSTGSQVMIYNIFNITYLTLDIEGCP